MSVEFHFVEQGSQEWHDARDEALITGSNIYKMLTEMEDHRYGKAENTGFGGNFYTKRGHLLEDEALELYQQITGETPMRDENGLKVGYVTNSKYPGCLFSPDDITHITQEVKAFSPEKHLKLINRDIDYKIIAQIQYGLVITELPYGVLLPYNPMFAKKQIWDEAKQELVENKLYDPSKAFKIIKIPRDRAIMNNFRDKLNKRIAAHA